MAGSKETTEKAGGTTAENQRFSCPICGIAFRTETDLRQHLMTVHHGGSYGNAGGGSPAAREPPRPAEPMPIPPGGGPPPVFRPR